MSAPAVWQLAALLSAIAGGLLILYWAAFAIGEWIARRKGAHS